VKSLLGQLLPPLLTDAWRRRGARPPVTYAGDYTSWAEALRQSEGYDAPLILEYTREAMRKIKSGEAVFERDALLLDEPEPPLAVIAGLLHAAADNGHRLHVLDFGGALGSSYFQCRRWLTPLAALHWSVIEQPAHVACGSREFADSVLTFHASIDEAIRAGPPPDVLLLSSVLQYLPEPHQFLNDALRRRVPCVILDRTAFHAAAHDRLTVQRVPAWIYPASYPAWFFAEPGLLAHFAADYMRLAAFPALDRPELPGTYACTKGFIYRLHP
jgi:putative methyltransferase (TIGR04325 family)